MLLRIRWADDR